MNRTFLFLGACFLAVMAGIPAYAMLVPQPLATDPRIKIVPYAPNEVIKYTGYYRVSTSWEFPEDETIQTISLGDSIAWLMQVSGNRLWIKPVEQDATTNMTLITDKRTYLFELHAKEAKSVDDKDVTWIMRIQPSGGAGGSDVAGFTFNTGIDSVPDLDTEDLSKYNFRYTVSGSEEIMPIRIFDDGEFTFFEFRDKNGEIPAFYQVDGQNNEMIINYRARGSFIVVERVVPRFTLRHGNSVVCVFNEAMSGRSQSSGGAATNAMGGAPKSVGGTMK